ncbi:MAG: undecaprenyldiphospho-muramoylpentapeptide beta-N-acetylglucosaminyltransferase [Lachnospiraceae bacterium]|nr:undecaprenyldiphospho-muramoylpentapeptide beta-N-acetylglucosaminyltransferase [Lachnospiraceae bacterium]
MKKIILTGGGTAGHVTPNIALLPELRDRNYEVLYIGSYDGMEKGLIEEVGLPYVGISSGKLRRYFDWKNFSDPFRVLKGYFEAKKILKKEKPNAVFSKGGFVSVPVVLAAKRLHIPAIIHESDITPGLANKLAMRGATKICCNFPETVKYLPEDKAVLSGCPIRKELLEGSREKALEFTGLSGEKPILLIIGGSLGSVFVNNAVRGSLDVLLETFEIIHLCGKGNLDASLDGKKGYVQYEFISDELPDLFAACDVVISRAGANAICELLALQKPNILVPLSLNASRGDQILNARSFESQGFSYVIEEEQVTPDSLLQAVDEVYKNRDKYKSAMQKSNQTDPIKTIVDLIDSLF